MSIASVSRWLLSLAAGLVVVWAFVDVGMRAVRQLAPGERPVTLTILHWGDTEEIAIVETLVREFERQHPRVRVRRLHASDYEPKLKTMFAAGDPPDLFYLLSEHVPEFAGMDLLLELDPHLAAADEAEVLADFYPLLLDSFRFNGEQVGEGPLLGLPKDFTTTLMYVNLDLFEAAGVAVPYDGWTWAEYEQAMRRIAALEDPTGHGRQVYGGVLATWPAVFRSIVWSHGGGFFGDGFTDVRLTEPEAVAAMEMIRRVRFEDGSVYNPAGIAEAGDDIFFNGRIGATGPLGRWMVPRFRTITRFDWDVVPMPTNTGEPVSTTITVAWAISRSTEHPAEAYDLLKFLTGREGQVMSAELGLAIPSLRSVAESDAFLAPGQRPANAELFLEMIDHARLAQVPPQRQWNRIVQEELNDAVLLGRRTPEQAGRRIEQRWHDELASPLVQDERARMPWGMIVALAAGVAAAAVAGLAWMQRRRRIGSLDRAEERTGWGFIAPWVIGFLALTAGPMVVSLLLSVARWTAMTPLGQAEYVGLDNYRHLFGHDVTFGKSLWVTTYYALLAVPLGQAAALAVAVLMNHAVRGIKLFRTMYFVPSVVSGVALATLWLWMFEADRGLLNVVLRPVTGLFGLEPPAWFGSDAQWAAIPAFVLMSLWGVGGGMVIYLAGLKGVPQSLYEAARIDGAGPWRQFWNVTLPMISPLVFFNLVMGLIGSFQVFTQAYVMTEGGPGNATLFYVLNIYRQAFDFHQMGYASAMAWVLFVILLVLTLLVFRSARSWVYYEGLRT